MKFSFSFPYKSAKFTEKQHSLMDTFAGILKLQRISGIAKLIDILNSYTKISIKQDECFMSEGQIKSVIPRRYNIHDFMIDLCELKEPKLITTFPISVSVIRDYSEVIESFLGKFKSLRRVICIDDIEEGFLEESIIPLLLIMCARCPNISSIEVPGFLFETDRRFLKSYADQYISIDISCISPR
uniref:Uncharacterized protein n=1 Tax=Euplotes harpa TaxID=151035 RepID=A0A7S3J7Y5_9SPIT|mmetsp:Transcript_25056/g.28801  ORF Transcript_25056/g.28801 Transcript_25056/m.28801 type:complete len:185 (+) Transcript_25056:1049-1603(+)